MPILYSVISRGTTVLAKYAQCVGNFAEVTEQIMLKIKAENHKLTYSHGNYLIHYICEDRIIYMCITDDVSVRLSLHLCQFISNMCLFVSIRPGIRAIARLSLFDRRQAALHRHVRLAGGHGHCVRNEHGILARDGVRDEALQRVEGGGPDITRHRSDRRAEGHYD